MSREVLVRFLRVRRDLQSEFGIYNEVGMGPDQNAREERIGKTWLQRLG